MKSGTLLLGENRKAHHKAAAGRDVRLDVLRSMAILYIVGVWHMAEYSPLINRIVFSSYVTGLMSHAFLALFVFLSGYLASLRTVIAGPGDALRFYRKRLLGIYPLYLASLTGFFLMGFINGPVFLQAAVLATPFTGVKLMTLWFVPMINVFYAAAPLFLRKFSLGRSLFLGIALMAALAFGRALSGGTLDQRLIFFLPSFIAGMVTARHLPARRLLANRWMLAAAASCAGAIWIEGHTEVPWVEFACVHLLALASLPVFWQLAGFLVPLVSAGAAFTLSYAAYVTYLLHRITFQAGVALVQPATLPTSFLYLGGLLLPLTVGLSYVIQSLYDRFLARMARPVSEGGTRKLADREAEERPGLGP